jgi:hypothetical protein
VILDAETLLLEARDMYDKSGSCRGSVMSEGSSLPMGAEAIPADNLAQNRISGLNMQEFVESCKTLN